MAGRTMPPKTMMKAWGQRLKAARIVAGFEDAKDLAEAIEMEPPSYRRYERGETFPPVDILAKIAALTNESLDFLVLGRRLSGK